MARDSRRWSVFNEANGTISVLPGLQGVTMAVFTSIRRHASVAHRLPARLVAAGVVIAAVVLAGQLATGGMVPSHHLGLNPEREQAPDQFSPVIATVLATPHPVRGSDDKIHLAYEMLILNPNPVPLVVRRIETFDPAHADTVLASLSGHALAEVVGSITGAPGVRIGPGKTGLAIMDLRLNPGAHIPGRLSHRLKLSTDTPGFPTGPFVTGRTGVVDDAAVLVSAPLPGGHWVDLNGCCAHASAHRTAVLGVNGAMHAAQRFAIDFVRLQPDWHLADGPLDQLSSYAYYGMPVRSATSGVVVSARDDLPDQVPFQPPTGITVATAPGNRVVVALGQGRFAMYAHLQPGSVKVSVGDHVHAGDVLGNLGNSGNSDFPHLHFQVMDAPSPLGSEGLPFVLPRFTSPGSIPPPDQIDPTQPIPVGPALQGSFENTLPLDLQVLNFGAGT